MVLPMVRSRVLRKRHVLRFTFEKTCTRLLVWSSRTRRQIRFQVRQDFPKDVGRRLSQLLDKVGQDLASDGRTNGSL